MKRLAPRFPHALNGKPLGFLFAKPKPPLVQAF